MTIVGLEWWRRLEMIEVLLANVRRLSAARLPGGTSSLIGIFGAQLQRMPQEHGL
jgi:hypothetical protein